MHRNAFSYLLQSEVLNQMHHRTVAVICPLVGLGGIDTLTPRRSQLSVNRQEPDLGRTRTEPTNRGPQRPENDGQQQRVPNSESLISNQVIVYRQNTVQL